MKALSKLGAFLASLLLVGLTILILVEIIGRSFFDYSTMLADEYSGYLYLAIVFLGLGYTFDENGHIRISLITSRLNKNKNRIIDIIVSIILLCILCYGIYYGYLYMYDSYEMEMVSESVSETPIYLTQIPMVIGLGLFILSCFVFLIKRIKNDI